MCLSVPWPICTRLHSVKRQLQGALAFRSLHHVLRVTCGTGMSTICSQILSENCSCGAIFELFDTVLRNLCVRHFHNLLVGPLQSLLWGQLHLNDLFHNRKTRFGHHNLFCQVPDLVCFTRPTMAHCPWKRGRFGPLASAHLTRRTQYQPQIFVHKNVWPKSFWLVRYQPSREVSCEH